MSETVLLAEDNERRADQIRGVLESRGFRVVVAGDGAEALGLAERFHPRAVVSDVLMPNMDGFELCWEIRRAAGLSTTPVVLTTTGWTDRDSSEFAREVGATAFVDMPMVPDILTSILAGGPAWHSEAHEVAPAARLAEDEFRRRHGERLLQLSLREAELLKQERDALAEIYRGTLGAFASALELRDAGAAHAKRVTGYVITLAEALGLGPLDPAVGHLVRSALLCDIGNMGIPQRILQKRGSLTGSERRLVQSHPRLGADAVEGVEVVREVTETVLSHHERWDGTGYPGGLAGGEIPWAARLIAVADAVDALTTERPYRPAVSFDAATEEVGSCSGTQFDPDVADAAASIEPGEWRLIKEQAESTDPQFDSLVAGYL
jgi:response regulator RpfG family c-di-GMP phosphodiesterase